VIVTFWVAKGSAGLVVICADKLIYAEINKASK
jgi:hypothetical protein